MFIIVKTKTWNSALFWSGLELHVSVVSFGLLVLHYSRFSQKKLPSVLICVCFWYIHIVLWVVLYCMLWVFTLWHKGRNPEPSSSCTWPILVLESAISPRSTGKWRILFQNRDKVAICTYCSWSDIDSGSSVWIIGI